MPEFMKSIRELEFGILTWNVSKVEYPHIKNVEHLHKLGHEHELEHAFLTKFLDVF